MDGLLDVIPSRARFSITEGCHWTRNILIRNVSINELTFSVTTPQAPFSIARGAERLGRPVSLAPGEVLPLQVALNRAALPQDGSPVCDFLVLHLELCRPFPIELVCIPEGVSEADVQCIVDERRRSIPSPAWVSVAAAAQIPAMSRSPQTLHGGTPNDVPLLDADCSVAVGCPEMRDAAPAADPNALAAIAAFLGEAPHASAMRCPKAVDRGLPAVQSARAPPARSSSARRRRDVSPPDSPESGSGLHRLGASAFDESRPPTPLPSDFQSMPRCASSERTPRPQAASCEPQAQLQQTQPAGREQPKRPPMPQRSLGRRGGSLGASGAKIVGGDGTGPGRDMTSTSLHGRKVMIEDDKKLAPTGGVLFLDGVGWCDEYGKPIAAAKGLPDITALIQPHVRTKLMPTGADTAAMKANRFSGAGRNPRRALSESCASMPKVSSHNRDLNWASLGGV